MTARNPAMLQRLRSLQRLFAALTCLGVAALWPAPALAHKASDSYLFLAVDPADNTGTIKGQWDIALRDLDFAIGLDDNDDGDITWGEVKANQRNIADYAFSRLKIGGDGRDCPIAVTAHLIDDHTDGAYAVMQFVARCPAAVHTLAVDYRLLADVDPQHRGLLRLQRGATVDTAILGPDHSSQTYEIGNVSRWSQLRQYIVEGIWHIWIGYDHILFLLSLLLPAVLVYREGQWRAVGSFGEAFWDVLKIVTAFTVAHSITLSLAALGLVSLPSRLVESAIAASVVLAALNNIFPLFQGRRWTVAGAFGLIHGFGFASVLADLGLPQGALVLALFGFNLGVEIGQLTIVSLFLPLAFMLRKTKFYRVAVLITGSVLIVIISSMWFAERAFKLELFGQIFGR
jgi:HupE / UreJ protein